MAIKYVNLNQGVEEEIVLENCVACPAYLPIMRAGMDFSKCPEVLSGALPIPIFPAYTTRINEKTIGPFTSVTERE